VVFVAVCVEASALLPGAAGLMLLEAFACANTRLPSRQARPALI